MQHNLGSDPAVAFDDEHHRIPLQRGVVAQKAQQHPDKIGSIDEGVIVLGIPFGLTHGVILGIVHQAVREACRTGIDVEKVSDSCPSVWIYNDGTLSCLPIDRNSLPAGVCTVESGSRCSSWPPVEEDKEGLGCGIVIGRLIDPPYPCLGRTEGEPVEITTCVEIIGVLFEGAKSRFWLSLGP